MADAPRVPVPGDVIAGKYQVVRPIGEGGMGVVVEAEHLRLRQRVAIKILSPDMVNSQEVVDRFEREAQAASRLQSPHVVRVTDVDVPQGALPYMVMELLAGQDLESYRAARGALPYSEACEYVLQACAALADAHEAGIVHRDLKPGNLFLTTANGRTFVKVLDFGISRLLQEEKKLTSAGAVMGTALYMSPEQVRGEPVDARSDIWSLGVVLYELLTNDTPWSGPMTKVAANIVSDPPPEIRARCSVPEPLARLVEQMLDKNVATRLQTIDAVIEGLAPHAPEGGLGREIAQGRERRSHRDIAAPQGSRPSLSVGTGPTPARAASVPAEKSTTAPTTTNSPSAAHSRKVVFALLAAASAAMLVAGFALIRASREKPAAVVADPSPPPVLAVSVSAPPPPASVASSGASTAPKTEPAPAPAKPALAVPHGSTKPKTTPPSLPPPPPPNPPPPKSTPTAKPTATNPITL